MPRPESDFRQYRKLVPGTNFQPLENIRLAGSEIGARHQFSRSEFGAKSIFPIQA
jgi:hypothetical protein